MVNCDFRRPSIHQCFGVDDQPRRVQETNVSAVKIVTNVLNDPSSNPAQVVAAQRHVVAAARGRFDLIFVDTAPLLTANDAVELVTSADTVLLIARIGVTKVDAAQRSIELLNRLDVAIAGVVLMGALAPSNDSCYYQPAARTRTWCTYAQADGSITDGGRKRKSQDRADAEMFIPGVTPRPIERSLFVEQELEQVRCERVDLFRGRAMVHRPRTRRVGHVVVVGNAEQVGGPTAMVHHGQPFRDRLIGTSTTDCGAAPR